MRSEAVHRPWATQALGCTGPGLHRPWAAQALGCTGPGLHRPLAAQALGCTGPGLYGNGFDCSSANSQISWGGKILYWVGEIFFCAVMPKAMYQHPLLRQFVY